MRDLAIIQGSESYSMLMGNKQFHRERYLQAVEFTGPEHLRDYLSYYLGRDQAEVMSQAGWRVLEAYLQRGSL